MESDAQTALTTFWPRVTEDIKNLNHNDMRQQELPLARIKRIMKLDDDVKMISSEAPALFSKAAEIFITELTLRAWIHTEDNKRRTLQRNDIAMAITKYDQFDFLIDIVPREEVKPARVKEEARPSALPTDQITQQYHAMLQHSNTSGSSTPAIQIVHTPQQPHNVQSFQQTASNTNQQQQQQQQVVVTSQAQQQQTAAGQQIIQLQQQSAAQQQSQPGVVQIIQQSVGPDGNIQQIPIQLTQQHLNLIRMQLASGGSQQPIIIQANSPVNSQPQQIIQLQGGTAGNQPIYITQNQQQ